MEKNASDVRNKKTLEAQTSEIIGCEQIDDYVKGSVTRKSKLYQIVKGILEKKVLVKLET